MSARGAYGHDPDPASIRLGRLVSPRSSFRAPTCLHGTHLPLPILTPIQCYLDLVDAATGGPRECCIEASKRQPWIGPETIRCSNWRSERMLFRGGRQVSHLHFFFRVPSVVLKGVGR